MQKIHGLPAFPESVELLHRVDPARNMRRFYRLEILPDLFGGVILKREWGRIGSRGQSKARWFDDPSDASAALHAQANRKLRRGYIGEGVDLPLRSQSVKRLVARDEIW